MADMVLRPRSAQSSHKLLPKSPEIQEATNKRRPRPNVLLLSLVLFLLAIFGIPGGWRFTSSNVLVSYPSLIDATIDSLGEGLALKKFSSVDLVKAYLARIAEVNETLHAVTEVNPDALAIATELDLERLAGNIRGPLHGIPILIKNNIATNDKMNTTAGSSALLGAKVPRDATVARKLRAAGAILLGKTNLSQWANFRSLNSSNGWSAVGGQVYGPYYPNQDPYGSSSGSGVASTLGLALGCLGSETDGSINTPASTSNVVGIKPTVGMTSRNLVIPVSEHQDTIGPMTRTVKDAAQILQAIAGVDPHDNYTDAIPGGIVPDFLAALNISALSGTRIGIPRNVLSLLSCTDTKPIVEAFDQTLGVLREAGAIIVENTNFTAAEERWNSAIPLEVINADFNANIRNYLNSLSYNPRNITSLAELREFTQSSSLEDFPDRDTGRWDRIIDQEWDNTDSRFWPAYQKNLFYGNEGGLLGAIERHDLDAVILPAIFASPWAAPTGAPIVTVPQGSFPANAPVVTSKRGLVEFAPNIPFGIAFLGARFSDAKLIGMAYAFEQRTMVRDKVNPYLVPRTELSDVVEK